MSKPVFIIDIAKEPYIPIADHEYVVPQDSTGCAICGMHEEWHGEQLKQRSHQIPKEIIPANAD